MAEFTYIDRKVDVYRNIEEDTYSIRSRETENYGTVIGHRNHVSIQDAQFVVQPAGRERVKDTGVKNVHAFVRGVGAALMPPDSDPIRVAYDPMRFEGFVEPESGARVRWADYVVLGPDGVYAYGAE